MKPLKTKAQIRQEIDDQVRKFLSHGGSVDEFKAGESGREVNSPLPKSPHIERNSQTRTPVLSEIQAIEARRQKPKRVPTRHHNNQSRKTLLTDDFGEPLRWVSED
ncbi:hypothetical protein G8770_15760 [Aestuariicella hydrocarbonica]|uniref:Transcriptional regulator SutA RNAP-binding domain-containing protein n=1 Tax=Pseudomaricurvus hydrocarbonicus TaxID=1470433 RepID=A0A9E5T3B4_9GAMM|nr:hypothetical protein [Aestuariicella hydrocarbonica]NHO67007.1 hypothetical protein [Aestuariicella hydrocarbonica]